MKVLAYLDNNATTQLAPEALAAMMPYLTDLYLNASSTAGELAGADRPIVDAKHALARLLGDESAADRFFLTSGATEANSWAVHVATHGREPGHLVSTAIEHPSLIAALEARQELGWSVDFAQPQTTGQVAAADVEALLRADTAMVSVILANNETGVLQPIAEIGEEVRARAPAALFHVDATQALGRVEVSLNDILATADLVSLSAHKFHGPKGVGALFAADGVRLPALLHGSQEKGRRGGTPNTAAAAGLAAAAEQARDRLGEMTRIERLRDGFEAGLIERLPGTRIVGSEVERLPNTSAFTIPGLDAGGAVETLALAGIVVASGSACASGAVAPSHVLTAMGLPYEAAKSTLRVSLSRDTTEAELRLVLDGICNLLHLPV